MDKTVFSTGVVVTTGYQYGKNMNIEPYLTQYIKSQI